MLEQGVPVEARSPHRRVSILAAGEPTRVAGRATWGGRILSPPAVPKIPCKSAEAATSSFNGLRARHRCMCYCSGIKDESFSMKRAVLYLRVSTIDQTTANQERELRQVAADMGCEIAKVYKDHGIS